MRPQHETEPQVDREQLDAAIGVLEQYGRQGFKDPENVGRGKAIGYALYAACDVHTIFDAAIQALEQWNAHLLVALLLAAQRGKWGDHRGNPPNGSIARRNRHVKIKLPQSWADRPQG